MLRLLSVEEAAKALEISERRVRQLLEAGRIKDGQKVSGVWVVPAGDDGVPVLLEGRRAGRPTLADQYAGLADQLNEVFAPTVFAAQRAIEEAALNSAEVRSAREALRTYEAELTGETNRALREAASKYLSRTNDALARVLAEIQAEDRD